MALPGVPSSSSAPAQNGTNSVEFLLKQVYAVHRNKIKELEHQLSVMKNSKQIESIATCTLCEELQTSLEQVKKEYDHQMKEKDKLIEELQSRLERAFDRGEADELILESEKPLKRKRWTLNIGEAGTSPSLESGSQTEAESPAHSCDPSSSQQDVVVLVPETLVDTQSDVNYISRSDCEKSDLIVPETLIADTQCWIEPNESTNAPNKGNCSKRNDGALKNQFYFDTPQKGYRRPKYKQTTLTQNALAAPIVSFKVVKNEENDEAFLRVDLNGTHQLDRGQSLTPIEQRHLQDSTLDETFVPSPYLNQNNAKIRASTPGDATPSPDLIFPIENVAMSPAYCDSDSTCSEDLLKQLGMKSPVGTNKKCEPLETEDSFNQVPSKIRSSPNYKYKRETVRRQEDRRKLDAHECRDCEAYFQVMDLTEEEKRERLKACSRHRDDHRAPKTPDHYWSIRFPTTQECKDRGVLENTQNKPLQRRRRPRHQLD